MKNNILVAGLMLVTLAAVAACSKKNKQYTTGKTPPCLKARIEAFSKSTASCPTGASLKQYTFQNKTVYVFEPGSCGADMASPVLDEDCKDIGSLGGLVGNMQINGENFSSATYVKTIWSN